MKKRYSNAGSSAAAAVVAHTKALEKEELESRIKRVDMESIPSFQVLNEDLFGDEEQPQTSSRRRTTGQPTRRRRRSVDDIKERKSSSGRQRSAVRAIQETKVERRRVSRQEDSFFPPLKDESSKSHHTTTTASSSTHSSLDDLDFFMSAHSSCSAIELSFDDDDNSFFNTTFALHQQEEKEEEQEIDFHAPIPRNSSSRRASKYSNLGSRMQSEDVFAAENDQEFAPVIPKFQMNSQNKSRSNRASKTVDSGNQASHRRTTSTSPVPTTPHSPKGSSRLRRSSLGDSNSSHHSSSGHARVSPLGAVFKSDYQSLNDDRQTADWSLKKLVVGGQKARRSKQRQQQSIQEFFGEQ